MSNSPYVIDLKPPHGFWTPPEWRAEYWRTAPVLRPLEGADGMSRPQPDGMDRHQPDGMDGHHKAEQQRKEKSAAKAAGPPMATMLHTANGYVMLFGKPVMLPARLLRRQ